MRRQRPSPSHLARAVRRGEAGRHCGSGGTGRVICVEVFDAEDIKDTSVFARKTRQRTSLPVLRSGDNKNSKNKNAGGGKTSSQQSVRSRPASCQARPGPRCVVAHARDGGALQQLQSQSQAQSQAADAHKVEGAERSG